MKDTRNRQSDGKDPHHLATLTNIFDQHYDAIILLERNFTCTYMNHPARRFFPDTSPPVPAGEFFPDPESFALFAETIRSHPDREFLISQIPLKGNQQGTVPASIKGKPISIDGQEKIFCSIRDITEKIHMEEKQRRLRAKLIQANKMASLGTMSSGIGHELNNPNNFILSNAQLLEEIWKELLAKTGGMQEGLEKDETIRGFSIKELAEEIPRMLRSIIKGSSRISRITDQLRDYSRPGDEAVFQRVDLTEALDFCISMLKKQIRRKTRHFTVNIHDRLPALQGDQKKLEQVMINLIQNALNALENPDQAVRVSIRPSPNRHRILLEVSDTGRGIRKEHLEKISDPFFTTRQQSGGTGLGLYICHSIVKTHQGDLDVRSREGGGTSVIVSLPATPEENHAQRHGK